MPYCLTNRLILMYLLQNFGTFGYNARFVKCDFIEEEESWTGISPRFVFFALESAVPCFLILIGYLVILCQVYSSSSALSFFGYVAFLIGVPVFSSDFFCLSYRS